MKKKLFSVALVPVLSVLFIMSFSTADNQGLISALVDKAGLTSSTTFDTPSSDMKLATSDFSSDMVRENTTDSHQYTKGQSVNIQNNPELDGFSVRVLRRPFPKPPEKPAPPDASAI